MTSSLYDTQYNRIVTKLLTRRQKLWLTQEQAAAKANMTRHQVGKIERFETAISVTQFIRLCHAYDLRAHRVLQEVEEESPDGDSFFYLLGICDVVTWLQDTAQFS